MKLRGSVLEASQAAAWASDEQHVGLPTQRGASGTRSPLRQVGHSVPVVVRHACADARQRRPPTAGREQASNWLLSHPLRSVPPGPAIGKRLCPRLPHDSQRVQHRGACFALLTRYWSSRQPAWPSPPRRGTSILYFCSRQLSSQHRLAGHVCAQIRADTGLHSFKAPTRDEDRSRGTQPVARSYLRPPTTQACLPSSGASHKRSAFGITCAETPRLDVGVRRPMGAFRRSRPPTTSTAAPGSSSPWSSSPPWRPSALRRLRFLATPRPGSRLRSSTPPR